METKTIIDLVTNLGVPVALLLAVVYWVGKILIPKGTDYIKELIEKIEILVADFKEEMDKERTFHSDNLKEFYANCDKQTTRLENTMIAGHADIKEEINRKVQ